MNSLLRLIRLIVVVVAVGTVGLIGVDVKSFAHTKLEGHSSNLRTKLTFLDGATQRSCFRAWGAQSAYVPDTQSEAGRRVIHW
jgi:hypothetical protein